MSERDNESFDLDDEFLTSGPTEDGTDYDRLLDRVDKRVRNQGKRGKAAWSKLEEVLADKQARKRSAKISTTSFRGSSRTVRLRPQRAAATIMRVPGALAGI